MDKIVVSDSSNEYIPSPLPQEDTTTPIDNLKKILNPVWIAFNAEKTEVDNKIGIFLWITITISLFLFISYGLIFCDKSWLMPDFETANKIKTWYEIGLRIAFVSLMVSIIVFCLKLLKSYLSLSEQISHKIAVIESISAILYANEKDKDLSNIAYIKIVEVLVQGNNIGLFAKDEESKMQSSLLDLLKVFKGLHT